MGNAARTLQMANALCIHAACVFSAALNMNSESVKRVTADLQGKSERFLLQRRSFQRQYAHLYASS